MNDKPNLATLAEGIARALGATLHPLKPDRDPDQWRSLTTPEGPELSLHFTWQPKGRLEAGVNLPTYKDRNGETNHQYARDLEWKLKQDGHPMPETRITADPARGAEAIARDIKRRLLPGAILLHQAALTRKADFEASAAGTNATVAQLCKALGHKQDKRHRETLYLDAVRLQVSSPNSVRFESFYTDAETAIAIYKLIKHAKAGA